MVDDQETDITVLIGEDRHVVELSTHAVPLVRNDDLLEIGPEAVVEALGDPDPASGKGLGVDKPRPAEHVPPIRPMVVDVSLPALVPERS